MSIRDARVTGIGVGLRYPFASRLLEEAPPAVRWLEIHPENYMRRGGRYHALLEQASARWPIVTHGLTMGFGASEPVERSYGERLKRFLREVGTPWHSDHLCFCGTDGVMMHDLLPLPFDREAVRTSVARVREAKDALELPVAVENVSYYADPAPPQMSEVEFLLEVLEGADANLLLDVNNIFVNSRNHGFDPRSYIDCIPPERVVQIHVAGHQVRSDSLIIDTHGEPIRDEVYELLSYALRRIGPVPVLLERDQNFPPYEELIEEVDRLDAIYREATAAFGQAAPEQGLQASGGGR